MLKNRSFDAQQHPTSFDQLHETDLGVNGRTGQLNGGSGWLNSVSYGSANLLENPAAAPGSAPHRPRRRRTSSSAYRCGSRSR